MNIAKKKVEFEAKMLITQNGFMVRMKKKFPISQFICFFVDEAFNHVPWKLTISKGLSPALGEYNRLKGVIGLQETCTLTSYQFKRAVELFEALSKDPFLGLTSEQRKVHGNEPEALDASIPVFERKGVLEFEQGMILRHSDNTMAVRRIRLSNVDLVPCEKALGGVISIKEACVLKDKGVVPIDYELMGHLLQDPDFFSHLLKKSAVPLTRRGISLLCGGSTMYVGDIPTHKLLVLYKPDKAECEVMRVGKNYFGNFPDMYQMVYRLPQQAVA